MKGITNLAEKIIELCLTEKYGTYHISNEGQCSWYEFACEIFKLAGKDVDLILCKTEEFPRPANRPKYSVLKGLMLEINGFRSLPSWQNSLNKMR